MHTVCFKIYLRKTNNDHFQLKDAHESDVNVISWNRHEPLIVSGSDDTVLKIWSLKTIQVKYMFQCFIFAHHSFSMVPSQAFSSQDIFIEIYICSPSDGLEISPF